MSDLSNSATLEDLRKEKRALVREWGRDSASGKDSLPKLAIAAVEWARDGIFAADDAKSLYVDYIESESKKLIHTEAGKQANASKLKQFLTLGGMTTIDGVDVISRAVDLRAAMVAKGEKPQSPYAAYLAVSRSQIASPNAELSDDEIREAMGKATKEETADKLFSDAAKKLEKALEHPLSDDERDRATEALDKVKSALAALVARNEREEKLAKIYELQAELDLAA